MSVHTQAIQKLYVAYFSRPADPAGLAFWEGVVAAANGNTAAVSGAFAGSAEYKAAYANKSGNVVIDTVYMNLFGRHAEAGGLDYWGPLLQRGVLTIDVVVTAVAGGALGADLAAYNAKVATAAAFTSALDTPTEVTGYSGAAAIASAVTFLAGVTDAASGAAAMASINLAASVLAVTNPALAVPGAKIAMTTGLDVLTGTAGNDLFSATAASLTVGDGIRGGGGTDTLSVVDSITAIGEQNLLSGEGLDLSSVEIVSITSSGGMVLQAATWTGVATLKVASTTTTGLVAEAATNTNVTLNGPALHYAGVVGGANVSIDNTGPGGASGLGTSMVVVALHGFSGTGATIKGTAVDVVDLANIRQAATITLDNASLSHTLSIRLDSVGYAVQGDDRPVNVTLADATAASVDIDAYAGSSAVILATPAAKVVTLSGAQHLALNANAAGNTMLATIDGAAATGDILVAGLGGSITTVATGSGADYVDFVARSARDNPATASVNESSSATLTTGAGNDIIYLRSTGDGSVYINAGADHDDVALESRSGNESFIIDLGAGNDRFFMFGGSIRANDIVKGGEGYDALALVAVNAANAGAFSGFEALNATNLNGTADVAPLAARNTIDSLYVNGAVGAANVINVAPGTEISAYADMAGGTLKVSMTSAAAVTLRVAMHERSAADIAADASTASFNVTNASSAKIVFESDFLARLPGESALGDNLATLNLATISATSASLESGGLFANNVLNYTDAGAVLTSMAISGAQKLALNVVGARLSVIDAGTHTGGLTVSTASLGNGGLLTLGTGVDVVTIAASSTPAALEAVARFERSPATAIGANFTDAAAAVADADTLVFTGGAVASVSTFAGGAVSAKGVLSFTGAGPATLAAAFAIANLAAETANEVLVFSYLNDSYVFMQGVTDSAVKLVGLTGIYAIVETGTDAFFVV